MVCHCQLCQRRTGSLFHVAAWFPVASVTFEGTTREFTRATGDRGAPMTFNFCPTCGTSVWWRSAFGGPLAERVGIAAGCFADPDFPRPTVSIYEKRRHPWIRMPEGTPCFAGAADPSALKPPAD